MQLMKSGLFQFRPWIIVSYWICLIFFPSDTISDKNLVPNPSSERLKKARAIESKRAAFAQFLEQHPYQHSWNQPIEALKKRPKNDRPDLAFQQNYLNTLNPALGIVPPQAAQMAFRETLQRQKQKNRKKNGRSILNWQERGPGHVGGRTRALMFDPNDPSHKKVWAGGVAGGLWYNLDITDPASSWQSVDDFWPNLAISSICHDPQNPSIFYVGTGEGWFNLDAVRGAGLWKSEDAGETWQQMSLDNGFAHTPELFQYVNDLVVRPINGRSEIWVASGKKYQYGSWSEPEPGLYRSLDGGKSFESVLPKYENSHLEPADIEITVDNQILVGSTQNSWGKGGGILLKSESGDPGTWELSNFGGSFSFGRVEVACSPQNPATIYAIGVNQYPFNNNDILWFKKSSDGGLSWQDISIPLLPEDNFTHFTRRQAWYNLILQVSPNDASGNTLLAGGINLHISRDGGASWQALSHWQGQYGLKYIHADQHQIHFRPDHPNEMILGNDGGVYYCQDFLNPPSFLAFPRNKGYQVTQFYAGAQKNSPNSSYMLGGTQDNGSHRFLQEGINETEEVSGGDGGYCHIDEVDARIQITSYIFSNFFISRDGGEQFTPLHYGNAGSFINPSDYDSRSKSFYFAWHSNRYAYIADLNDETPETHTAVFGQGRISHIKVSPFSENTIYVGTTDGKVYRVENAQSPFPQATRLDNLGAQVIESIGSVSCIALGQDPSHLIVTFYNYGVTSVWESRDGGQHWSNKEGNLPDMPIRWALIHPAQSQKVVLATETGIFSTQNIKAPSPDWQPDNQGLALVRCDMLDYRKADGQLLVATHGRGIFTSASWKEPIAWTGRVSQHWEDKRNWIPELVPQANHSVVIPGQHKNHALHIETPIQIKNLWIEAGGELIIGDALEVSQQVNSEGQVTLKGRTLQSLPSGTYKDLMIDNAAGVRLGGDLQVSGQITLQRGNLDLNSFEIDLGNSGFLEEKSPYAITGKKGEIKAHRYLSRPKNLNIAGLGIFISSDEILGTTRVSRKQQEGLPFQSIRQVFGIHPSNNQNLNAELRIAYKAQELNNLPVDRLQFFRSPDQGIRWYLKGGRVDADKKEIYLEGIQQFSDWTAGFDIALSNTFIQLQAQRKGAREVKISWCLPLNSSIPEFEIQKSEDAQNFQTIARKADSDKNTDQDFVFEHRDLNAKKEAYYRLKYNNSLEDQTFSNIAYVAASPENSPQVFPNPFGDKIQVQWPGHLKEVHLIELFDQNGQLMRSWSPNIKNEKPIELKNLDLLSPGAYFLRIKTLKEKFQKKILKSP